MKWKTFNNSLHFHAQSVATVYMTREWQKASHFPGNISHELKAAKKFHRPEKRKAIFSYTSHPILVTEVQLYQGQTVTFFQSGQSLILQAVPLHLFME